MEWLMGKARGVSRGFMHIPNTGTSLAVTESSNASAINAVSVVGPTQVTSVNIPIDCDCKYSAMQTKEINISNGVRKASPICSAASSPVVPSNPYVVQTSVSLEKLFTSSKCPQEMKAINDVSSVINDIHLYQQLPLSTDNSYPDFTEIVEPFPAMDTNEWLAAHAIALFDNLSTIFDAIYELCDCHSLLESLKESGIYNLISPLLTDVLSSLPSHVDDDRNKKGKGSYGNMTAYNRISARLVMDSILSSCHDLIQSPRIFPVRNGESFPSDLPQYVSVICKNLLVCITHIYVAHLHHLKHLELIPHMNTLTRHFFAFSKRFALIEDKQLDPLCCFTQPTPTNMSKISDFSSSQ